MESSSVLVHTSCGCTIYIDITNSRPTGSHAKYEIQLLPRKWQLGILRLFGDPSGSFFRDMTKEVAFMIERYTPMNLIAAET